MNMFEHVARALCKANGIDPDEEYGEPGSITHEWWFYLSDAKTAIEAMREPTEEMLSVAVALPVTEELNGLLSIAWAHGAQLSDQHSKPNTPLQQWWRAMIDEALKDGEKNEHPWN